MYTGGGGDGGAVGRVEIVDGELGLLPGGGHVTAQDEREARRDGKLVLDHLRPHRLERRACGTACYNSLQLQ